MTDGDKDNDKVCEIAEGLAIAMRRAEQPRIRGLGDDLEFTSVPT